MWPRDLLKGFASDLIEEAERGEVFALWGVLRDREGQFKVAEICCSLNDSELGDAVYDLAFQAKAFRSIRQHLPPEPPRIPPIGDVWQEEQDE